MLRRNGEEGAGGASSVGVPHATTLGLALGHSSRIQKSKETTTTRNSTQLNSTFFFICLPRMHVYALGHS